MPYLYLNSPFYHYVVYIRLNLHLVATPVQGGRSSHNVGAPYTSGVGSVVHGGADDVSQITGGEYRGAIINLNQDVNFMNIAGQEVAMLERHHLLLPR